MSRVAGTCLGPDEIQTPVRAGGLTRVPNGPRQPRAVLDALARDTRSGLRRLVRDWRFTTAAVLILGLAIGANTAIFSLVNAVLFRQRALADS